MKKKLIIFFVVLMNEKLISCLIFAEYIVFPKKLGLSRFFFCSCCVCIYLLFCFIYLAVREYNHHFCLHRWPLRVGHVQAELRRNQGDIPNKDTQFTPLVLSLSWGHYCHQQQQRARAKWDCCQVAEQLQKAVRYLLHKK